MGNLGTGESFVLRGGHTTTDRRLDRLPEFDPRNRAYPIRALLAARPPRSYTWRLPQANLDQGSEGACVGFSWTQELASRPVVVRGLDADYARGIYHAAQTMDEWPGEAYEGTSVLAGAKAVVAAGHMGEYRWAFGLEDVIDALAWHGPVVLGIDWMNDMFDPDADGLLHATGGVAGGHAIEANGVSLKRRLVRLENSWSPAWGIDGHAYIGFDDLRSLLANGGEACVPVQRL